MLVLPATANILAVAAAGGALNRLATVILAVTYPVVFFPHMGAAMWEKPAVQRNVARICEDGNHVVEPVWHESYVVASQSVSGHSGLPSPSQVVNVVEELLSRDKPA